MFEGSTASGAERAYKKAVQKLTQLLIEDGLFHAIVLILVFHKTVQYRFMRPRFRGQRHRR